MFLFITFISSFYAFIRSKISNRPTFGPTFFSLASILLFFILFYISSSDEISQDRLQYYLTWYSPSQLEPIKNILLMNDPLFRLVLYFFPSNLSTFHFNFLFSIFLFTALLVNLVLQLNQLNEKMFIQITSCYLALLFLVFDRLGIDQIFNASRSFIACLFFTSFIFARSNLKFLYLLIAFLTHVGLAIYAISVYFLYLLCTYFKFNFRLIFFISFGFFALKLISLNFFNRELLDFFDYNYTKAITAFCDSDTTSSILLTPNNLSQILNQSFCNLPFQSTLRRGLTLSGTPQFSLLIQIIIISSCTFLLVFYRSAKNRDNYQFSRLADISIFYLSCFLLLYPDFNDAIRSITVSALISVLIINTFQLRVVILFKALIFSLFLLSYLVL